jgi:hypothetical protein
MFLKSRRDSNISVFRHSFRLIVLPLITRRNKLSNVRITSCCSSPLDSVTPFCLTNFCSKTRDEYKNGLHCNATMGSILYCSARPQRSNSAHNGQIFVQFYIGDLDQPRGLVVWVSEYWSWRPGFDSRFRHGDFSLKGTIPLTTMVWVISRL